jgi:hypothetical protein
VDVVDLGCVAAMIEGVSTIMATLTRLHLRLRPSLRRFCSWLVLDEPGNYQPERYYMRGPGPKWRERHGEVRSR